MSNPARAYRVPIEVPDEDPVPTPNWPFLYEGPWVAETREANSLSEVTRLLRELDLEPRNSFLIPREHTVAAAAFQSSKPFWAVAKHGVMSYRISSGRAFKMLEAIWKVMPEGMKELCGPRMKDSCYVDGGAENTLGRLLEYAPKAGAHNMFLAPTELEAADALLHNGLDLSRLPTHAFRAYPLFYREHQRSVVANPHASTGYPVLGRFDDNEAIRKVNILALEVREAIRERAMVEGGVERWLREEEDQRPWLVSLMGKAKADHYKSAKVKARQLRFYNTYPGQIMRNIQVATQPLENAKRSILQDSASRTSLGVSLTRRGAGKLVAALQAQLDSEGFAYVHCGDDSWVLFLDKDGRLHEFALDCSSFDLTQHSDVMRPLHQVVHSQLVLIDKPAADLWYSYMRRRQVVLAHRLVVRMRHMGPSGSALQSFLNGMLMDVLICRIKAAMKGADLRETLTASRIEEMCMALARQLGLRLRLEQYNYSDTTDIQYLLAQQPFLFVGYEFGHVAGEIRPFIDLPRQMAQLRFPGLKWMKKGQEMQVKEAMRLGSMLINWGMPFTEDQDAVYQAAKSYALKLIDDTLDRFGDSADPALRWAVFESPFGAQTEPALSGLRGALARDPRELWMEDDELPSDSTLIPATSWAEAQDEEEERERASLGIPEPPLAVPPPPHLRVAGRKPAPTHPTRMVNWGRQPPTAVWGPDKPARARAPMRIGRFAAVVDAEEEYFASWREPYDDDDESVWSGSVSNVITQEEFEERRWALPS